MNNAAVIFFSNVNTKSSKGDVMGDILKSLIPLSARSLLLGKLRGIDQEKRRQTLSQIPCVPLEEKHISRCRIVLDRKRMLEEIGVRGVVAELGVNKGDFSEILLKITKPDVLHLVDIWGSERYHDGLFDDVRKRFLQFIKSDVIKVHRKLSTEAVDDFPDAYFDMIYIDTDHSYGTTIKELIAYAPKMKKNGIIAGHDYTMGNWITGFRYGVVEAVHEFCVKYDWELIFLTAEPMESRSFAIRKL